MYKVFISDKQIILTNQPVIITNNSPVKMVEVHSRKDIKEAFNNLIKNPAEQKLLLYNNSDEKKLLEEFISLFWYVEAAGGMVYNQAGKRLFIYRFGKWDLPKGKVEKSESHQQAAIREVQEETGLIDVQITDELPSTFHVFDLKGKKVLKRTYWYRMLYTGTGNPTPQIEEDITEVVWFEASDIQKILANTYDSLKDLISGSFT